LTGLPAPRGGLAAAAWANGRPRGRDLREFYYLYFGVGLGGRLARGAPVRAVPSAMRGEIGTPLVPNGEGCARGNRGCPERHLVAEAMERRSAVIGLIVGSPAAPWRSAIDHREPVRSETIILGGSADGALLSRLTAAAERAGALRLERGGRHAPRITRSKDGGNAVLRGAAALAVAGVLAAVGPLFAQDEGFPARRPASARRPRMADTPLLQLEEITKNFYAIQRCAASADRSWRGGGPARRQRRRQVHPGKIISAAGAKLRAHPVRRR
jgi:hypothetical protein